MTDVRVDQAGHYALVEVTPDVRVDQGGIQALAGVVPTVLVDQGGMFALIGVTAVTPIVQAGMYVLASGSPCGTRLCQVWTISREDGAVYRFTSLDHDWTFNGVSYRACDSLVPSASQAVSEVDAAGTMDLSGAIGTDAGSISEHDLYSGLFDGAYVEAWLVPWQGFAIPRLLLRGNFGPVEQGQIGFKVEMLGDGARLQQTPLVRLLQPGCRWIFGDSKCQKDLAPLTVTGTIDSGQGQRGFTDAARGETAGYFNRGRVTFTSGDNAGISAEIKSHASGGVFEVWPRLPYGVSTGDQYSMTPGCTNLKASVFGTNGCTAWGQLLRYGGFDKVPGGDKRSAAADVR
jgi:uncharacterized phage protein (TIGR02218 family)